MTTTTPTEAPEEIEADLPGWLPPVRQPSDDPLDPEVTTTIREGRPSPSPPDPGPASGDESPPRPTMTSKGPGRSPGFTDPAAFLGVTGALVGLASMGVHYARRAPEGLWLADEEDVANIAGPLARIAARHSPVSGTEANDVGDALAAAVGVAGYAMKNLAREAAAKSAPLEQQATQPDVP